MDESMDRDSSISPNNYAARRAAGNPPNNIQTTPPGSHHPDESYDYDASDRHPDTSALEGEGATVEEVPDPLRTPDQPIEDDQSDSSSIMFDPDVDPEGFARRLDELAGSLEMGEEEARAIRWGPQLEDCVDEIPLLSLADFKALVNHHLDTTEWRYTLNRDGTAVGASGVIGAHQFENHPIRIVGPVRDQALAGQTEVEEGML